MARVCCAVALAVSCLAGPASLAGAEQDETLTALLDSAAAYVARYQEESAAIVSEERYRQTVAFQPTVNIGKQNRVLRSDVIVIRVGGGWLAFRDVFEVDAKPVRDRDDRLAALFIKPTATTLGRSQAIADESARFNIGSIHRNVNVPTMALAFLEKDRQSRSTFRRDGFQQVARARAAVVTFTERARPTLIRSGPNDVRATSGRFWLEPERGRVLRSELTVEVDETTATITVTYAPQPKLPLWMPVAMTERYQRTRGTETITGAATYSNFRVFRVDVQVVIK